MRCCHHIDAIEVGGEKIKFSSDTKTIKELYVPHNVG
jgi:hypothetical protein